MSETLEQRAARLDRVLGTLRNRLIVCRAKRAEQAQRHEAQAQRLRDARDGYKQERDRLRAHIDLLVKDDAHGRYVGCYILMRQGSPVYVGQSINVFGRIASHRGACSYPTRGAFDEVRVIWCAADALDATERRLIEELRPPMNNEGVVRPYIGKRQAHRPPADLFGPVYVAVSEAAS
jgi:hypothetical protein